MAGRRPRPSATTAPSSRASPPRPASACGSSAVDINRPDEVATLRRRLEGERFELVFVNAGITRGNLPVSEVTTEDFLAVMETNVLSVMRVVEAFGALAVDSGTVGVMSSRQGSLTLNTRGGEEVYRASKAALNQLMRSYAVRHQDDPRSLVLMSPGWVKTGLGGDQAPYEIGETIPGVVDTIARHAGQRGLRFVDWQGETVPW